jgi:hypothetical protein
VAALTSGNNASCTQPVSIPTTARRRPEAGTRSGSGRRRVTVGVSDSITRSVGGNRSSSPVRRSSRSSPLRWYSASGPRNARNRFG